MSAPANAASSSADAVGSDAVYRGDPAGTVLGPSHADQRVDRCAHLDGATIKSRLHGELHLGQVLLARNDFLIIDFEGEPVGPEIDRGKEGSVLHGGEGSGQLGVQAPQWARASEGLVGLCRMQAPTELTPSTGSCCHDRRPSRSSQ